MMSLDSETLGKDLFHSSDIFFLTMVKDEGDQAPIYWEWDVDPLTRKVTIPEEDARKIRQMLACAHDGIVGQNIKFDATALLQSEISDWTPLWPLTRCTLTAGHLLASNLPHDLTSMVLQYLGVDLQPYERALDIACHEARRFARSKLKDWSLAEHGKEGMPSCPKSKKKTARGEDRESAAKYDMWLPRAIARYFEWDVPEEDCEHEWRPTEPKGEACHRCGGHRWHIVLREYGNADSCSTLLLWQEMWRLLQKRKLVAIYESRMRGVEAAWRMERRGVTLSQKELTRLKSTYQKDSEKAKAECVFVAAGYEGQCPECKTVDGYSLFVHRLCPTCKGRGVTPYRLQLPKSGVNKSLRTFIFDHLKLPVREWTEGGDPALNKRAMDGWEAELNPGRSLDFLRHLKRARKRDTMVSYLDGYQRFWLQKVGGDGYSLVPGWFVLHPSFNPTGTSTLRWSCQNPNGQNVSKEDTDCLLCAGQSCDYCNGTGKDIYSLRRVFGPAPGREWWSLDAKNIELRIPAYESGEQELIELFERPQLAPYYGSTHLLNFHTVYPDIWDKELREVGPDKVGPHCKKKYAATWYQWCKNGGFAVQYGAMDRSDVEGTADRAFHRQGSHSKLKERFVRLEDLNQKYIRYAQVKGYVETLPDRTVDPNRGYPILCTRTERGSILPTVPLNYHTQSTAMWWTTQAMVKVQRQLDEWAKKSFDAFITLQVHDELVLDLPRGADPRKNPKASNLGRIRKIQSLMASCGDDLIPQIPTPVGCEFHPVSWGEGFTF